ncbi:phosphoribosylglycinamide formyltransferase [Candidatus Pacearchaeota archaeon]|nr:phosphoribosylglycinamide formyltransferase [Candidatus Pacearchaeota archaeon]
MINLGVLASGKGTNLQAIINACENREIDARVVAVISDNKDAYALEIAKQHNIPSYYVNKAIFSYKLCYEEEIVKRLNKNKVNLIVLAGYMKIVEDTLLSSYENKIMNIHPSLLPCFPGKNAIEQAYNSGVKITGVTIHFVDKGVDTGPIILQSPVPILENDSLESLTERVHQEEHKLYKKAIQLFIEGRLKIDKGKVRILEEK